MIARDPELVHQVFTEATEMQSTEVKRLKSERQFLLKQKTQRDEELRRTAASLSASECQPEVLSRRIAEINEVAISLAQRIAEIDNQLATLTRTDVNIDHVAATLAECDAVWDVLRSDEQCQLVDSLVERVECGVGGEVAITFRSVGAAL